MGKTHQPTKQRAAASSGSSSSFSFAGPTARSRGSGTPFFTARISAITLTAISAGVLAVLRARFREPIGISELADIAHLSTSALHLHFKTVTSFTPLQYVKQLRLQEARRLLVTTDMDAAAVAFEIGYESPSQFSREYARMFGDPPVRDRARLLGTSVVYDLG